MADQRPANPIAAALWAFVMPGLGFVYLGRPRLALLIASTFSILFFAPFYFLNGSFTGLVLWVSVVVVAQVFIIARTVAAARREKQRPAAWYTSTGILLVLALALNFGLEPFAMRWIFPTVRYHPYRFPSGSMAPTLRPGEHFIVDTWWPGKAPIKRGDLVSVESPQDYESLLIKRCVAVAGDTVEIRDRRFILNGKPVVERYVATRSTEMNQDPEDPAHLVNMFPVTVPEGRIFVMGDERDNSLDSRAWGPVSVENIHGRPLYIWWSSDHNRIGTTLR